MRVPPVNSNSDDTNAGGRKLDIFFACESCNAGVGRHVIDLSAGLASRGHRVHLVYASGRLDDTFREFLAAAPQLGIELSEVAMRRAPGPWDATAALAVRRAAIANGPFDVLHGHSSKGGALVRLAALLRGRHGAAVLYSPHAMITMDPSCTAFKRRMFAAAERMLARWTDRLIAVSSQEREHLVSVGLPRDRIDVVPLGTSIGSVLSRAAAREKLGVPPGVFVAGFVGRLSGQKAPDVAIDAWAEFTLRIGTSAVLVMIGDGPDRQAIEQQIADLGLSGRVILAGKLQARHYLSAFDAFLLTSRYESFGFVLIEAAQAGLPLVSTPVGVATDLICEVGGAIPAGLIVPIGDPSATADAIASLAADPARRAAMGAAARSAASSYTIDAMVEAHEHIYRMATAGALARG